MTQTASIFELLREFTWRGISVPIGATKFSFRHDLVEHKWADRDGASIEATGRAPLQISAIVHMRNGIVPGINETWTGPLYPDVFRTFLEALLDRTSGDLGHPELGTIRCKVSGAECDWDPTKRDGIDLNVTWIESSDSPDDLQQTIASPSPISTAIQFAADLDSATRQLPSLPQQPNNEPTFEESMRSLQAIGDTAKLASREVQGVIDRVAYRVNALEDSAAALKDSRAWPIIDAAERIKAALYDLRLTMLVANKAIRFYVTPTVMTAAQICVATKSKIADILALNPRIAGKPTVNASTTIRYYG